MNRKGLFLFTLWYYLFKGTASVIRDETESEQQRWHSNQW